MPIEKRVTAPVVAAVLSVLCSVGVAVLGTTYARGCEPEDPALPQVRVRMGTPHTAAETYLDAWRKRRYDLAAELSVEHAHREAEQRAEVEPMLEDDAVLGLWRELAQHRLELDVSETEYPAHDRVVLYGTAVGSFVDHPYQREISFETVQDGDEWRVARMQLGEVLEGPPLEHLKGLE